MNTIIECNNISKTYEIKKSNSSNDSYFNALSNISFSLNEGDRLGLVGLNGSGKSTLLKIIGGFIKPSSGSILIKKSVSSLSGFDSMLHPDLNAIENSKLQLQILGFKKNELPSLIEEILIFSELEDFAYQPVKTFSSGMMLRLSFAIFSVTRPEILLLDEVFSAGDINFQRKIQGLMQNTFKNTAGIIIASHQLTEIQQYCNKCLVLNNGIIEFYGEVDNAMKNYCDTNIKSETIYHNDFVKVENITINSTIFKTSDSIKIKFRVCILINDIEIYPSICISNLLGKVLTDSPVYNSDFVFGKKMIGEYEHQVEIPSNLLNDGTYNISIILGNTNKMLYVTLLNQFTVTINNLDWRELTNEYPIRTKLNWEIKSLNNKNI
jgi:ABC-type polysaccharide/polyol phosphate transport system ATPase subunit